MVTALKFRNQRRVARIEDSYLGFNKKLITAKEATELKKSVEDVRRKLDAARMLYYGGDTPVQINKMFPDLPIELLEYQIHKSRGWSSEKTRDGITAINYFVQCKSRALEETAGMALHILCRGLKDWSKIQDEGGVLNEKQLLAASSILNNLDKIQRLEDGKATDIIQRSGLTVEQAREQLKADPMAFGIIDVTDRTKDKRDDPIDISNLVTKDEINEKSSEAERYLSGIDDESPNVFGENYDKGEKFESDEKYDRVEVGELSETDNE